VIKNKLAPPFKNCSFDIIYGKGIDKIAEIIDIGHDCGVLKVFGKSTTYNGVKYDGKVFDQMIEDNEELYNEIKEKIMESINNPVKELVDAGTDTE